MLRNDVAVIILYYVIDSDEDDEEAVPVNSIERMLQEAENSGITQLDSNRYDSTMAFFTTHDTNR